jgi:hypothetical protein
MEEEEVCLHQLADQDSFLLKSSNLVMKKIYFALASLGFAYAAIAQNEQDALRFSQNNLTGSARVLGSGGAFGALGSDMSAVAINPAGIGLYRRTEISLSAAVTSYLNDSRYIGTATTESKTGFNIPQLGIVYTKVQQGFNGDETKGIVSYSFGFGINRLNDLNANTNFSGNNSKSSITDYYAEQANGKLFPGSYSSYINNIAGMAWNTYLIDATGANTYASTFKSNNDSNFSIRQSAISRKSGSNNEYAFSSGLNLSNTLFLGASLLFQNVNYENSNIFSENVLSRRIDTSYTSSDLIYNTKTTGTGVGGRFGIIYKPIDYFRVGVSYTTAVRLNLKDEFGFAINSVVNGKVYNYSQFSGQNKLITEYDIVTPSKLTLSGAIMHPKIGFISFDWDRVDFTQARISSKEQIFLAENNAIKTNYAVANNIRIGSEFKYKNARFRAGYSYYGTPFNTNTLGSIMNNPTQTVTGGLGFLFPAVDNYSTDFFIDAAMGYTWNKNFETPYQLTKVGSTSYTAENQFSMINVLITAGFRF